MPAIYPARLQHQVAHLAELYGEPARFTHSLTDLLELYSNRAHRSGQAGDPPTLLRTYNVPKPVIRQLMLELKPLAEEYLEESLVLIRHLWAEESLETRQIAAFLLGSIPADRAETIFEMINTWLAQNPDERVISLVLQLTLARIRSEAPDRLFFQIESWLDSERLIEQQIGLKALKSILTIQDYENVPQFIKLLVPYTRKAPLQLRSDILETLQALAYRSPKETAYLLRQSLYTPENPDTALLVRKLLPAFPPDLQNSLIQSLRDERS